MSISKHAIIQSQNIGRNVVIGEFSIIRPNVRIGDNVIIHPSVIIEDGSVIGDNVEIFPNSYIGKIPKGAGALSRQPEYEKSVNIGNDCSIGPNAVLFYDVVIGSNTLIGTNAAIREKCKIGNKCVIASGVTINYGTHIGDRTKIMDLTHITGNCRVGKDVFIGMLVSTANDNQLGKAGYEEVEVRGPHIEDHVRIGHGAIINPRVRIGEGSLIGGNSAVTRDVPAYSVVMGVPAKIVKTIKE